MIGLALRRPYALLGILICCTLHCSDDVTSEVNTQAGTTGETSTGTTASTGSPTTDGQDSTTTTAEASTTWATTSADDGASTESTGSTGGIMCPGVGRYYCEDAIVYERLSDPCRVEAVHECYDGCSTTGSDLQGPTSFCTHGTLEHLRPLLGSLCSYGLNCGDTEAFSELFGTELNTCKGRLFEFITDPTNAEVALPSGAEPLLGVLVHGYIPGRSRLVPENIQACARALAERNDCSSIDPCRFPGAEFCSGYELIHGQIADAAPCPATDPGRGPNYCMPYALCIDTVEGKAFDDPTADPENFQCVGKSTRESPCTTIDELNPVDSDCSLLDYCGPQSTCTRRRKRGETCRVLQGHSDCELGLVCGATTGICDFRCREGDQ